MSAVTVIIARGISVIPSLGFPSCVSIYIVAIGHQYNHDPQKLLLLGDYNFDIWAWLLGSTFFKGSILLLVSHCRAASQKRSYWILSNSIVQEQHRKNYSSSTSLPFFLKIHTFEMGCGSTNMI